MILNRQEADELFEKIAHVGKGFEQRLAKSIPIVYLYTKPGEVPKYKGKIITDIPEYLASSPDLSAIPSGLSKYNYLDKCRDSVQEKLIDRVKLSQGDNNTFLLFIRPRIEATTTVFNIKLDGRWVKEKNVKQIDAPEDLEDPFPCE